MASASVSRLPRPPGVFEGGPPIFQPLAGNGRILLHDEIEERPNVFSIVPIWENVSEEDIMTPRDVFELMTKEGYKVRLSIWYDIPC